ncbi:hypothetical protein H5410_056517 [Solanum commersonii]|uniref:Uncharacterized protein n=1 Tax=Solanum commersonii TaxID=4109 RepID=A0A9J5WME7_SOLCO|nr:hypothetical protein H5410_056517 [Solanum commersonii]
MGKQAIFYVKRSPVWVNPLFCQFSCAIFVDLLVIQISDVIFAKNFMTSFKTLVMELASPDRQTNPFSRSNEHRSGFLTSFLPKVFTEVRQDLSYGADWSRRVKLPIFKMGKSAHFHGQMIREVGKPPVLPIFVCYSPWIFW